MHTHTHLTLANHASSDIVHRMFSCNAFDTHRHPQTDDALHKHNFAPDKCIQCYGNRRCEQKQLQLTMCFSFGWRECMFYPCLVQTIMFGNMSTHVDTNRQNSPKSIKRQINTETMINDKFGKKNESNLFFPEKHLHVWKQIHSLIIY